MPNPDKKYDLLIKNVRVVRPKRASVQRMDIGVKDGKFAKIGKGLKAADAATTAAGNAAQATTQAATDAKAAADAAVQAAKDAAKK